LPTTSRLSLDIAASTLIYSFVVLMKIGVGKSVLEEICERFFTNSDEE
jgi:hypothetical protein